MENPLISVIVPVYKVEEYFRKCADSILGQSYRNLEIILVDDGSPDSCPALCDEYAKADSRVRVIHKENGGLSDARNAGLDIASGDYIGFVDSDDWIAPGMYEELVRTAVRSGAEIACCGYTETNGIRELAVKSLADREKKYTAEEALREVLVSGDILVVMWNKIYRRGLFDDIRFPKGETFEDGAVFYRLFGKCACIAHTGKAGYYYRKRDGSITFTDYGSLSEQVEKNYQGLIQYLGEHYPGLTGDIRYYRAETDYYLAVKYLQAGGRTGTTEYKTLKKALKKDRPAIKGHPRWGREKKLKVRMVLSGIYTPARKIFHWVKSR